MHGFNAGVVGLPTNLVVLGPMGHQAKQTHQRFTSWYSLIADISF
jgi:hypothetical protein